MKVSLQFGLGPSWWEEPRCEGKAPPGRLRREVGTATQRFLLLGSLVVSPRVPVRRRS